jgi:hypothetical protein
VCRVLEASKHSPLKTHTGVVTAAAVAVAEKYMNYGHIMSYGSVSVSAEQKLQVWVVGRWVWDKIKRANSLGQVQ